MIQANTRHTIINRRAYPAVVCVALCSCITHRFEYDNLDRMVKEIRLLGQTITYSYNTIVDMVA